MCLGRSFGRLGSDVGIVPSVGCNWRISGGARHPGAVDGVEVERSLRLGKGMGFEASVVKSSW